MLLRESQKNNKEDTMETVTTKYCCEDFDEAVKGRLIEDFRVSGKHYIAFWRPADEDEESWYAGMMMEVIYCPWCGKKVAR